MSKGKKWIKFLQLSDIQLIDEIHLHPSALAQYLHKSDAIQSTQQRPSDTIQSDHIVTVSAC